MATAARPKERKKLPVDLLTAIFTESGYRCAVPTCRNILALDMHHVWEVSAGGQDELSNLIALCPTCHALYHRGTIKRESIYAWKAMLVALGRAFDVTAIDSLMFLSMEPRDDLYVSGDGVLHFSRLVAAGLVEYKLCDSNAEGGECYQVRNGYGLYVVKLTEKGIRLVKLWKSGDRNELKGFLGAAAQATCPSQPKCNREVIAIDLD